MSKPIFYEGQQVGCLMLGEGIVGSISNEKVYVTVKRGENTYYLDGKYYRDSCPTLYPIEQYRQIIANLPAPEPEKWQPKLGEWCWFWVGNSNSAVLDKFQSYNDDMIRSKYKTIRGIFYDNCAPFTGELPKHLKEVQP